EVHSEAEIEAVLPLKPRVIGVNNRNLKTFTLSLDTTFDLVPGLVDGKRVIVQGSARSATTPPSACSRRRDWPMLRPTVAPAQSSWVGRLSPRCHRKMLSPRTPRRESHRCAAISLGHWHFH
ncbi:MAG: hypothetical protein HC802_00360, partial [Caldilineaceae bacterium]|nr:hypothetical protein [Caldilineaceae bacterium]